MGGTAIGTATFEHGAAGIVLIGMVDVLHQRTDALAQPVIEGRGMRRPRAQHKRGGEEKGAEPYARLDHAFWITPLRLNL